jgi:hypothetical protein
MRVPGTTFGCNGNVIYCPVTLRRESILEDEA